MLKEFPQFSQGKGHNYKQKKKSQMGKHTNKGKYTVKVESHPHTKQQLWKDESTNAGNGKCMWN